jgi:hypothetical protein
MKIGTLQLYACTSTAKCHTLSHSVAQCRTVSHNVAQFHTVSHSVAQYRRVSHSVPLIMLTKMNKITRMYTISQYMQGSYILLIPYRSYMFRRMYVTFLCFLLSYINVHIYKYIQQDATIKSWLSFQYINLIRAFNIPFIRST